MKSILVPIVELEARESVFATAVSVARHFGGVIDGFCVKPIFSGAFLEGASVGMVEDFEGRYRERAAEARRIFFDAMRGHGLPVEDGKAPGQGPAAAWRAEVDPGYAFVGSWGRVHDVTVVGRAPRDAAAGMQEVFESALFESGRPVIVAGRRAPETLGRTIAVIWNGGTETARAISFAMPLLVDAEKVVVLAVEGGMVPGPDIDEVVGHLQRHGVTAEGRWIEGRGRGAGESLLEEAAALGADLLVKGAFTHSRLRQLIFGGVTSHLLSAAEIPVLMAH